MAAQTICTTSPATVSCTQVPLSSALVLSCTKNISLPSFSSSTLTSTPHYPQDSILTPKTSDSLTQSILSPFNEHSAATLTTSENTTFLNNNLTFNNIIQKLLGSTSNNNYKDYQDRIQISDKSNENMPPPHPESPSTVHKDTMPRKRRRKREDPQSCFTSSEVILISVLFKFFYYFT